MNIQLDKAFHFKITEVENYEGIIEYYAYNSTVEKKYFANVKFQKKSLFKPQPQNIISCMDINLDYCKEKIVSSLLRYNNMMQGYASNYSSPKNSIVFFKISNMEEFPRFLNCVFNIHENLYNLSLQEWTKNYNPTEESIISNYETNFLSLVEENVHRTR